MSSGAVASAGAGSPSTDAPPTTGAPGAAQAPGPAATQAPDAAAPQAPQSPEAPKRPPRLQALDAARGLAIVVMLVVMNPGPSRHLPAQLHHPDWHGLTFADLFFPLFLFAMGVSMTLSARGLEVRHVLYRAGVLFVLGVALASLRHETFGRTGVLQHIAVSSLVALAVLKLPRRAQPVAAAVLVLAYWAAFELWAPGSDAWSQSGTLAHRIDRVLLDGFTTEGSLQSLVSGVTVVAGAFVGRLIRALPDRRQLAGQLAAWAAGLIAFGLVFASVVPLNKRLWTPSFTVLTIGTSVAWLALGIWLIDVRGARRATAPLVHLGTNPIAIYIGFFTGWAVLGNHGGSSLPQLALFGHPAVGAYLYACAWTALWWLVAYALYRRRIFLKL